MQTETQATRQYHGVYFGRQQSKRTDFAGRGGPGPGDYEPYRGGAGGRAENANIHDEDAAPVRYEARIPRYSEAIIKETEKKVSGNVMGDR